MSVRMRSRYFYGYVIVITSFSMQFLGWGLTQSFGVFFTPMLTEFGWSRAVISGSLSFNYVIYGFANVIAGRMADRIGPRIVMTFCGILLGTGCLLMSQVGEVWQLYLFYGLIMGLGISGTDVVLLATVARWFRKKRGTMSGVVKVGGGVSLFVMPLAVTWLTAHFGWRVSYLILGIPVLILYILASQFLRRDPEQMGLIPDGSEEAGVSSTLLQDSGITLREAIGIQQFWMICVISVSMFFCTYTIAAQIVPHAIALGIPSTSAASVLSIIGVSSILGRLMMGNLCDRMGSRIVMGICILTMVSSLLWLLTSSNLWMLWAFAVPYGFSHGAYYASISPLVAGLFGLKAQGSLLGFVFCFGPVIGALGPVLAGEIFDLSRSYSQAFLLCAVFAVIALLMIILLRPIAQKT